MNREYSSITYATRNEANLREVVLAYKQTWWEWLLRKPALTETWVGGTIWYNKHTGECASMTKSIEINGAVHWTRLHSEELNRF